MGDTMMKVNRAVVLLGLVLATPLVGAVDTFEGGGRIDSVEAANAEVTIRGEDYRIDREMVWEARNNEGERVGLRAGQYVLFSGVVRRDRRVIESIVVTPRAERPEPLPQGLTQEPLQ